MDEEPSDHEPLLVADDHGEYCRPQLARRVASKSFVQ
jgi:hypothetical protein